MARTYVRRGRSPHTVVSRRPPVTEVAANPLTQAQRELQALAAQSAAFPTARRLLVAEIKRLAETGQAVPDDDNCTTAAQEAEEARTFEPSDKTVRDTTDDTEEVDQNDPARVIEPTTSSDADQPSEPIHVPETCETNSADDETAEETATSESNTHTHEEVNEAERETPEAEEEAEEDWETKPNTSPAAPAPSSSSSSSSSSTTTTTTTTTATTEGKGVLKIRIPVEEYPGYNFIGRLLGPRGATLKQMQADSGCRLFIRGRGSLRAADPAMELHKAQQPGYEHLREDLHMLVEHDAPVATATERGRALAAAEAMVRALLVPPESDEQDELKKRQLRDLAILNGTFKENKTLLPVSNKRAAGPGMATGTGSAAPGPGPSLPDRDAAAAAMHALILQHQQHQQQQRQQHQQRQDSLRGGAPGFHPSMGMGFHGPPMPMPVGFQVAHGGDGFHPFHVGGYNPHNGFPFPPPNSHPHPHPHMPLPPAHGAQLESGLGPHSAPTVLFACDGQPRDVLQPPPHQHQQPHQQHQQHQQQQQQQGRQPFGNSAESNGRGGARGYAEAKSMKSNGDNDGAVLSAAGRLAVRAEFREQVLRRQKSALIREKFQQDPTADAGSDSGRGVNLNNLNAENCPPTLTPARSRANGDPAHVSAPGHGHVPVSPSLFCHVANASPPPGRRSFLPARRPEGSASPPPSQRHGHGQARDASGYRDDDNGGGGWSLSLVSHDRHGDHVPVVTPAPTSNLNIQPEPVLPPTQPSKQLRITGTSPPTPGRHGHGTAVAGTGAAGGPRWHPYSRSPPRNGAGTATSPLEFAMPCGFGAGHGSTFQGGRGSGPGPLAGSVVGKYRLF